MGFVLKTHGYKGFLKIVIDDEDFEPNDFLLIEINQKFVPFQIESYNPQSDLIKLKGFDSDIAVQDFVSANILKMEEISEELTDFDIIGYDLIDIESQKKYPITDLDLIPNNPLIEIRVDYKDCLLPFHEDIILSINHELKLVTAKIPDGLLDL